MLNLRNYRAVTVLLIAGIFTLIFTLSTLNLLRLGIANLEFIRDYGWIAIMEGALIQLAKLAGSSAIALISYMGFKLCEHELVQKYRDWQGK
jgi:hypothetical protein